MKLDARSILCGALLAGALVTTACGGKKQAATTPAPAATEAAPGAEPATPTEAAPADGTKAAEDPDQGGE